MTLPRTSLLLALLAALAPATRAAEVQTTDLAAIHVKATTHTDRNNAKLATWGNAPLHDTPASVTVIPRALIDDRQIRTLSELARTDAALGDNYAAVGYYQNISIRGYPLDLATGYRLNGLTLVGEQKVALEDKQQVEVLSGLAGLDAGVMEPGGVVNYVSKRPAEVRNVTLGTDSHGARYGALDVGTWLTPSFGVRANLAWEDIHSYVQHANGRRNFYSLAADWRIAPNATLELDSDYQTSAQRSVSGYQLLGGTVIPQHPDPTRLLGYEPWQLPVGIHSANTSARFRYAFNDDWNANLAASHSRSVIQDNVAFAYGCFYQDACANLLTTGAYFAPDGGYDIYDYRSPDDTRVADEARATLQGHFETGAVSHDLTLGASAFRRTIDRRIEVYDYVGSANIADNNPPYFAPSPNQPGASARRLTSWQHSLFAMDRLHFGTHWQAILGSRFVRLNERDYDSSSTLTRNTSMSRTLPQAAVLWQPTTPITVYASYVEGLSLGLAAPYWASNPDAILGPRLSRQLETGVKYALGDAFNLSAALYHIRQPYQYAQPDDSAAGYTFVEHGEEVHTGIELGAHGQLTTHLRLDASANLIRAEARNTGTPSYDGHQVANVPRLRVATYLDYSLPMLPQLALLGGWRYASPNVATADGRVRVPAYNVFDAGLRYTAHWGERTLTWRLAVDNVFDHSYWRDTGSAWGDSYLFPGAPRLARLSVTIGL